MYLYFFNRSLLKRRKKLSLMRYAKAFQPKEIAAFLSNLPAYSADKIAEIAKQTSWKFNMAQC